MTGRIKNSRRDSDDGARDCVVNRSRRRVCARSERQPASKSLVLDAPQSENNSIRAHRENIINQHFIMPSHRARYRPQPKLATDHRRRIASVSRETEIKCVHIIMFCVCLLRYKTSTKTRPRSCDAQTARSVIISAKLHYALILFRGVRVQKNACARGRQKLLHRHRSTRTRTAARV